MKPILVIASVHQEVSHLMNSLACEPVSTTGHLQVHAGRARDKTIIIGLSGIGKVNAASATASLILQWQPELIINTGCAGAFPEAGLETGDLAIAISELFGDEGVMTPEGWKDLQCIGIPLLEIRGKRYFNEIPLSLSVAEKAGQLASALGIPLRRGRFLTMSTCSGTAERGRELYGRFAPVCENMEGAAVALVSLQQGIDCLEVRGISNMVEDRDLSRWDIPRAVGQAQRFLLKFLEEY